MILLFIHFNWLLIPFIIYLLYDILRWFYFRCQTYEGGFGGVPGMEAHGGYAFCGIAALTLLGHERLCDLDALLVSEVLKYKVIDHFYNL